MKNMTIIKMIGIVCISLCLLGSMGQKTFGYSAQLGYFEGFDLTKSDVVKNKATLIVIIGNPRDEFAEILKPPELFDRKMSDFYFEPAAEGSMVLLVNDTLRFAVLPDTPMNDINADLIGALDFPDPGFGHFSINNDDTIVLLVVDGSYVLLGNIVRNPDFTVSFDYQKFAVSSQIPEPSTLLLLGLGLLGIVGYATKKFFRGTPAQRFLCLIIGAIVLASLFPAATAMATTYVNAAIRQNTVWTKSGSPYIVTGNIEIALSGAGTAVLTIEPGVEVRFNANAGLVVGGSWDHHGALYAQGTEDSPIIFTSNGLQVKGSWKGIRFTSTTTENRSLLEHVIVEYAGLQYDASILCEGTYPVIKNSTIRQSSGYPVKIEAQNVNISNLAYEDNAINATLVKGGTIHANTTWGNTRDEGTYVVEKEIFIADAVAPTLTIEPGVTIRFKQNAGLQVGGSWDNTGALYAKGTANEQIVFTSDASPKFSGSWKGIYFTLTTIAQKSLLEHVIVEYAGDSVTASIRCEGIAPIIQNSMIRQSSSYPIKIEPWDVHLKNLKYEDNAINATLVAGGTISVNTTWGNTGDEGMYVIDNKIFIEHKTDTPILTITPGVEMRFKQNAGIQVGGSWGRPGALSAKGTLTEPILFTSNTSPKFPGSWQGIYFLGSTVDTLSALEYCIIEYAGNNKDIQANIFLDNASPSVTHNTSRNSSESGIRILGTESNNADIQCNQIEGNRYGISVKNTQPNILNNNIVSNLEYGMYNPGIPTVSAEHNWWSGNGNIASGNVLVEPVLTAASSCANSQGSFCDTVSQISQTECQALVDFYTDTGGDNWNNAEGWLQTNTPCSWYGIACSNGHVVSITLENNLLTGTFSNAIEGFPQLTYLNVRQNQLTGAISTGIGKLSELTELWLGENQFASIPPEIQGLTKLRTLDLGTNQLTLLPPEIGQLLSLRWLNLLSNQLDEHSFPSEFASLDALEGLSLHNNRLKSVPAPVSQLKSLKSLDLSWNKPLESLAGIGQMTGLHTLKINQTETSALPQEIVNLTQLKTLDLQGNLFTAFPSEVTQLVNLERLQLTYNPDLDDQLPLSLMQLTHLKEFLFDGTKLCVPSSMNTWLASIPTVKDTGLTCSFSCDVVVGIPQTECSALVDFYTSTGGDNWNNAEGWLQTNTPCSWHGITCSNEHVVSLKLEDNMLTGTLTDAIGGLPQLTYLNVRKNQLTGAIPAGIGNLSELTELWGGENQFISIPPEIQGLTKLRTLDLGTNQLMLLPPEIGQLLSLRWLNLLSNQLDEHSFPSEFANLDALEGLSLHNNRLKSVPAPVTQLKSLKSLDLSWNKPLESLTGLEHMTSLEVLKLNQTEQTDLPQELSNLTSLKELWLQGNAFTTFPSVVTQLLNLEKLFLTYNPQLQAELPFSLMNLTLLKELAFDGTLLCVPSNSVFQDWLASIQTVKSSGLQCSSTTPTEQITIRKAGNGAGTVTVGDYTCGVQCSELIIPLSNNSLSVFQATPDADSVFVQWQDENGNVLDGTYEANSGDIVIALFNKIVSDENYLSLYTNPTDPQILKLSTKDGNTVEYFAEKDEKGRPTALTHIYATSPKGAMTKVIMDEQARPARFLNDDGTDLRIEWLSDTVIEVTMTIPGEQTEPPILIDLQNPSEYLSEEQGEALKKLTGNFQDVTNAQTLLPSMSSSESKTSANTSTDIVNIFVKRCDGPANDAIVELRVKYGESTFQLPCSLTGDGEYSVSIPVATTGIGATAREICEDVDTALGVTCEFSEYLSTTAPLWCAFTGTGYSACVETFLWHETYCMSLGYSPSPGEDSVAKILICDQVDDVVERAIDILAEKIYLSPLITVDGYQHSEEYEEASTLGPYPSFTFDIERDYQVSAIASPTSGTAPLTVTLTATRSQASQVVWPDTNLTYTWSSSDGQSTVGQNASIQFTTPGTYTIILTVTDEYGCTNTLELKTVTVEEGEICEKYSSSLHRAGLMKCYWTSDKLNLRSLTQLSYQEYWNWKVDSVNLYDKSGQSIANTHWSNDTIHHTSYDGNIKQELIWNQDCVYSQSNECYSWTIYENGTRLESVNCWPEGLLMYSCTTNNCSSPICDPREEYCSECPPMPQPIYPVPSQAEYLQLWSR